MAEKKKTFWSALVNGLLFENPTFVLMVGMCPTLAVTIAAGNAIGMGLSTTVVLVCSNLFISLLRNVISEKIRIPAFIVVNCIIFARAEAFAFKNGPILALGDGLGMGLGFTLAITILASVRELFGSGTLFGIDVMGAGYQPMKILTAPSGGFLTLGILLIIVNLVRKKLDARMLAKKEAEAL